MFTGQPTQNIFSRLIMGCCDYISQLQAILKGNLLYLACLVFELPTSKSRAAGQRIKTCHACEHSSWLTATEFGLWLKKQGLLHVLKNLTDLQKLPDLPIEKHAPGKKLFCAKCKCFAPGKAYDEKQTCPLGKWQG